MLVHWLVWDGCRCFCTFHCSNKHSFSVSLRVCFLLNSLASWGTFFAFFCSISTPFACVCFFLFVYWESFCWLFISTPLTFLCVFACFFAILFLVQRIFCSWLLNKSSFAYICLYTCLLICFYLFENIFVLIVAQ